MKAEKNLKNKKIIITKKVFSEKKKIKNNYIFREKKKTVHLHSLTFFKNIFRKTTFLKNIRPTKNKIYSPVNIEKLPANCRTAIWVIYRYMINLKTSYIHPNENTSNKRRVSPLTCTKPLLIYLNSINN